MISRAKDSSGRPTSPPQGARAEHAELMRKTAHVQVWLLGVHLGSLPFRVLCLLFLLFLPALVRLELLMLLPFLFDAVVVVRCQKFLKGWTGSQVLTEEGETEDSRRKQRPRYFVAISGYDEF